MTKTTITPTIEQKPAAQHRHRNPAASYLLGLREGNTRSTMRRGLQRVVDLIAPDAQAEAFPWWRLRAEHARQIRATLRDRYAPQTVNISLSAIRQVMKIAYYQHRLSHLDYMATIDNLTDVRNDRPQSGRFVSRKEIERMLETCDMDTPKGLRDATIIVLLFYGAGLRRSELSRLKIQHYQKEARILKIRGKGGRLADQVISQSVQNWLERWLDCRGRGKGYLFCEIRRGGNVHPHRKYGPHAVWEMFKKRARVAGLQPLTPHDARRTFISNLLDKTDLATVQALARHADPGTTSRYDRRGEATRRNAVSILDVPDI